MLLQAIEAAPDISPLPHEAIGPRYNSRTPAALAESHLQIRNKNRQQVMNASFSSIPVHRIARALLLVFAATAASAFFSACAGPAYRHEHRVERRDDRQDYRVDRRHNRWDRRYERWD
jgi:hypothetical protein